MRHLRPFAKTRSPVDIWMCRLTTNGAFDTFDLPHFKVHQKRQQIVSPMGPLEPPSRHMLKTRQHSPEYED